MRVAVIDDHPIFVEGLRALLGREEDLLVVAEAPDVRRGLRAVEHHRPDLVVLDIGLPGLDGLAAIRELRRRPPRPHVLVLTVHERPEYASQALSAGALGFAFKSQPAAAVIQAIRSVGSGKPYLAPGLTPSESSNGGDALSPLSTREREVFALLVRGFTNQQVAAELTISIKTVETHRARIHRKLDLHSVGDLVRYAARHDLLRD
jgi:two-component system NarL family response regulator